MEIFDFDNINIDTLHPLQDISPDGWVDNARQLYGETLSNDMISQSVEETCDFFHIEEPTIVSEGWATGVYPDDDYTLRDDILIFNREHLLDMGISGKDGLDLVMTHEGTHRVLHGIEHLELNSHQEELCCDYMAGVRAGLNGIDVSQMERSLIYTSETETHPAGVDRVESIEAGIRFAQQYYAEYNMAPTFNECLDNFCEINETGQREQITLREGNLEDGISFKGHLPPDNNSDGYIPNGKITLERTESGNTDTFKVYNKNGGQYVHEGGRWIRVDGNGTVNIKGIKYDKT